MTCARRGLVVAVVAVAALAPACGLRADERPQAIPRERLDERLFAETGEPAGGGANGIWVLSNQGGSAHLVPTRVNVPNSGDRERAVLEALLAWAPSGPPGTGPRLTSRIPYGTVLRGLHHDGNVLTVDLSNFSIEGPGQVQALAQIVYTATDLPGIDLVTFTIDGKPVAVPIDDQSSTPGARLGKDDFRTIGPEPTTGTTAPATPPVATSPTTAPPRENS
jgi:hypothetical protein